MYIIISSHTYIYTYVNVHRHTHTEQQGHETERLEKISKCNGRLSSFPQLWELIF